jgi:hypothetical protein
LDEAVKTAERALEFAEAHRKRVKQAEIELRKASRRLEEVARTVEFESREPVTQAAKKIADVRTAMLQVLFGGDK